MKSLNINELLRYILAGGIALLAVWLGYTEPNAWLTEKREGALISFAFIALPILIGALAYVLHRALAYPIFYYSLAKRCGRKESILNLDITRWKNLEKPDALQKYLSEWAAQVHFLYAAFWAVVIVNFVATYGGLTSSPLIVIELSFLLILLAAAVVHHSRLLLWEASLFQHDAALPSPADIAVKNAPICRWTPPKRRAF